MSGIEFLNNNTHRDLKVFSDNTYQHAKSHHMTYLLVHEFPQTALNFPIVFVKDGETGQFKPVALFGFEANENVFYTSRQWNTTYVPANIRRYPFLMAPKSEGSNEWAVCIDTNSESLSTSKGEPLFNQDGSSSEQLERVKEFLTDFVEREELTQAFTRFLVDKDLFKANSIDITNSKGEKTAINGLYTVDEDKLNELDDADYLELKNRGYIGPIYSHLTSMGQIERIMILRNFSNRNETES